MSPLAGFCFKKISKIGNKNELIERGPGRSALETTRTGKPLKQLRARCGRPITGLKAPVVNKRTRISKMSQEAAKPVKTDSR